MRSRTLAALLRATRPHNGAICAVLLILGAWPGTPRGSGLGDGRLAGLDPAVLMGGLALMFLCAAAHLVNDLVDLPADRWNRPSRPLPAGLLRPEQVRRATGGALILGLVLGLTAQPGWWPWWLLWALGGPGYSLIAKGRRWIAPLWAAALVGSCYLAPVTQNGIVSGDLYIFISIIYFIYFREFVKACEDLDGDLRAGDRLAWPGGRFRRGLLASALALPLVMAVAVLPTLLPRVATTANRLAGGFFVGAVVAAALIVAVGAPRPRHWSGTVLKFGAICGLPLLGFLRSAA